MYIVNRLNIKRGISVQFYSFGDRLNFIGLIHGNTVTLLYIGNQVHVNEIYCHWEATYLGQL